MKEVPWNLRNAPISRSVHSATCVMELLIAALAHKITRYDNVINELVIPKSFCANKQLITPLGLLLWHEENVLEIP